MCVTRGLTFILPNASDAGFGASAVATDTTAAGCGRTTTATIIRNRKAI